MFKKLQIDTPRVVAISEKKTIKLLISHTHYNNIYNIKELLRLTKQETF